MNAAIDALLSFRKQNFWHKKLSVVTMIGWHFCVPQTLEFLYEEADFLGLGCFPILSTLYVMERAPFLESNQILTKSLEGLYHKWQKYNSGKTQACSHVYNFAQDLPGKLKGFKASTETGGYSDLSGHSEKASTWIYSPSIIPHQYLIHISPPIVPC